MSADHPFPCRQLNTETKTLLWPTLDFALFQTVSFQTAYKTLGSIANAKALLKALDR
jgi:hypothetical protein